MDRIVVPYPVFTCVKCNFSTIQQNVMRVAMENLLIFSAMLVTACSSSKVIRSSDPDSRIYVKGEYMGTGHAQYADQKVAFSKNDVEIRKDGCAAGN